MAYRGIKKVLNRYFARIAGNEERPVFFDIHSTYPSLDQVTQRYEIIKKEFENVLQKQPNMPLYHEIDPGETEISNSSEQKWKVFMLYLLGHKPKSNRALCPETCRIIDKIPNLMQAFFSILEPGKSIPLHKGPYLGYLRYHLGLHVPKDNPPCIYVNGQEHIWQEGKAVLFDDSWPHAVENESKDYRAVLIVDVLRPMPILPSLINKLVTSLLGRYTYGRWVINRLKGYKPDDAPLIN